MASTVRPCVQSKLKDMQKYPSWVITDEVDSDVDSESDSAFQNLFKRIQMNEYSTDEEDSSQETPRSSAKDDDIMSQKEVKSSKLKVDVSSKVRTGITRPTLFMKAATSTHDGRKSTQHKRNSTNLSLSGGGNVAALRILFLQNAFAENVLPLYRKKDRVYLSITHGEFNRCHKSEAVRIADRVKRILNKNFVYLNDRDIAEDLELKFEKLIQNRISKRIKEMEDNRKIKDHPATKFRVNNDKPLGNTEKLSLINQLNYSMPHRNFETDITKYVKRLGELADILSTQSNDIEENEEEDFDSDVTIQEVNVEKRNVEYTLIPTIERYNKTKTYISELETSESKEETNERKESEVSKLSGERNSFWKKLTDSIDIISKSVSSKHSSAKSSDTISKSVFMEKSESLS